MKFKKSQIGWSFVVKMIIGIMVLGALIYIAVKSKGTIIGQLSQLTDFF